MSGQHGVLAHEPMPERPPNRWPRKAPADPKKDRTITRLAVLKAAAEFAASRPELKSGDVLKIAASWEAWANR